MADRLFLSVTINKGTPIVGVYHVSISQRIFSHHDFSLSIPSESLVENEDDVFDKAASIVGQEIFIDWESGTFKKESDGTNVSSFKGIITRASVSLQDGHHVLLVSGAGPTMLMDGVVRSNTFADIKLDSLYSTLNADNLSEELKSVNKLTMTQPIPFPVQFNETDFGFFSRIAHECGEWFYYDGNNIHLGLDASHKVELDLARVFSLEFDFNTAVPSTSQKGRDYDGDKPIEFKSAPKGSSSAKAVVSESKRLFPSASKSFAHLPSFMTDKGYRDDKWKEMVRENKDEANMARVLTLKARTDISELTVGTILKKSKATQGAEYVIIAIEHECDGQDNYSNQIIAIPSDVAAPPYTPREKVRMAPCVATVFENEDPKKLGRVRVQYGWGTEPTPYIRMIHSHAGKDRGSYFIPEVGDEVMICFEGEDVNHPIVMGSLFHTKASYTDHADPKNKLKAFKTVGGNELIIEDDPEGGDESVITIRNKKNSLVVTCKDKGKIEIKTDGEMLFEAGEDITMKTKKNFTIEAMGKMDMNITKDLTQAVKGNYNLKVTKAAKMKATMDAELGGNNVKLKANMGMEVKGTQTKVEGAATTEVKGGITQIKGGLVKIN